jgi:hypothetical protein
MATGLAVAASVGSLYDRAIVDTGKDTEFLFFVAFIVTFAFIRTSAHMIRAQVSWWPGNVEVGGTHIHHLVWGILLLLVAGYVGVAVRPDSPWAEISAILFGVGTGLALDEFALWLTLKDVYWESEGRRSIDAVIIAVALTGLVLVGFRAWVDVATGVEDLVFHLVGWSGLVTILAVTVNLLKEKFGVALLGVVFAPVALVGAFRLARPSSPWARRYGDEKRHRAELRFAGRSLKPLPAALDRRLSARHAAAPDAGQAPAGSGSGSSPDAS